jgi:hypothetical protein
LVHGLPGERNSTGEINQSEVLLILLHQPIAELVKQIPADTWKILQEIQKRRPAMMLDELLDKQERAPKQPPNAHAPNGVVVAS